MRERFFEAEQTNDKKAIQRDLEDAGISHPSEWRKAIDLEADEEPAPDGKTASPEGVHERVELNKFSRLFAYLEGVAEKVPDRKKIEAFQKAEDELERLELLRSMSTSEAAVCIRDYGLTDGAYGYLTGRLDFYQKLIEGKAVKRYHTQEWNSEKGVSEDVLKEDPIDASTANPETIRLGLFRDTMFAAMIGTPEMAIFKISSKRCKDQNISTGHFPLVKGYHSDIHERSIGHTYPFLKKTYERARRVVEGKYRGQEMDEQQLEHKAVMIASGWLTEAMNYNDPGRRRHSPYASTIEEATAWARLGDRVKAQLRGMRRKIQGIDLHNIERFIGKAGDGKYSSERKRVFGQIKFLKETYDTEAKDKFTSEENQRGTEKQNLWRDTEIERLRNKFTKTQARIEKLNLPEEEEQLQLESAESEFNEGVAKVQGGAEEKINYFQTRTSDQLLVDLEERQKLVEVRYEKRKSLAQKALDLHFHFNHTGGRSRRRGRSSDDEQPQEKPYAGVVDWVNYAPLGTIKRAHGMLRKGISDKTVMEVSIADIILGKNGIDRESLQKINNLSTELKVLEDEMQVKAKALEPFNDREWNDPERQKAQSEHQEAYSKYNEKQSQIQNLIRAGSILANRGYALSLEELIEFSKKNIGGLYKALGEFSLDEVKYLLDNNVYLESATNMKQDLKGLVGDALPVAVLRKLVEHPGGKELIRSTIEAGFTVEEITRFPFLISPLVTKK